MGEFVLFEKADQLKQLVVLCIQDTVQKSEPKSYTKEIDIWNTRFERNISPLVIDLVTNLTHRKSKKGQE